MHMRCIGIYIYILGCIRTLSQCTLYVHVLYVIGKKMYRPFTPERFSPEDVRPYPKAGAWKKTSKNKCKTLILTYTPVKQQLVEDIRQRGNRKTKKSKPLVDKLKTKRSKKTTVLSGSDSSDDEEIAAPLTVDDSNDYEVRAKFYLKGQFLKSFVRSCKGLMRIISCRSRFLFVSLLR